MASVSVPFKGLAPYGEDDATYFFGRASELQLIADNLLAAPLTVLYGATGVGKTSLLTAGLRHRFRQQAVHNVAEYGAPEVAVAYVSNWREDPAVQLSASIAQAIEHAAPNASAGPAPRDELLLALHTWTKRIRGPILVLLDQFEEYFLYQTEEVSQGTLAYELTRIIDAAEARTSFLVSIREDALAWLDFLRPWIPNLFQNCIRLRHLTMLEARQAILGPIEAYNRGRPSTAHVRIEPTLVDQLLEDIGSGRVAFGTRGQELTGQEIRGSIEAPYLQLVMRRLWDEERARGSRLLRTRTLLELGGAERIVRVHLDDSMQALSYEQQQIAASAFQYLVTPSGNKFAQLLSDLSDYIGVDEAELADVLARLVHVRILRQVAPPGRRGESYSYEIFHDLLAPAILDWRTRFLQEAARSRH